ASTSLRIDLGTRSNLRRNASKPLFLDILVREGCLVVRNAKQSGSEDERRQRGIRARGIALQRVIDMRMIRTRAKAGESVRKTMARHRMRRGRRGGERQDAPHVLRRPDTCRKLLEHGKRRAEVPLENRQVDALDFEREIAPAE